ncbi:hypothetical protein M885DRAFT_612581 [Pelagophyceae sp. CCMP2097]|nr:hypothetical protein M885DRAFT_612581 [Pelagophyceae sp. CCMP2097]
MAPRVFVWCALALAASTRGETYDGWTQQILDHAREAARLHNAGNVSGAAAAVEAAAAAFDAAIDIDDGNPQAYLTAANFFLNIHNFERALFLWDGAEARLGGSAAAYIAERREMTLLGLYSVRRDAAYAAGQGNVLEALAWARKQHELLRKAPRYEHDVATLEAMLAEVGDAAPGVGDTSAEVAEVGDASALAHSSEAHFRAARSSAADAAAAFLGSATAAIVDPQDDPDAGEPYGAFFDGGAARVRRVDDALVAGRNGVVLRRTPEMLEVFNAPIWAELHGDLWLLESWRSTGGEQAVYDHSLSRRFQPPNRGAPTGLPRIREAALVVGFASSNYYHLVTDVLPRIIFLQDLVRSDAQIRLLVPKVPQLRKFLQKVLPFVSDAGSMRVVELDVSNVGPGVRARVDALHFVEWPRVQSLDGLPTHSLTPAPLLGATRSAVLEAFNVPEAKNVVVYATRAGASTRRFANETVLVDILTQIAFKRGFRLVIFDGHTESIDAAVHVFAGAAAVVGVHGAALANILWCSPKALVVELGLRAPAARHYEHLSAALGLDYERSWWRVRYNHQ